MGHNPAVQTWATAQSTHSGNGRIIVWRFAENLVPSFERSTQPDRIILEWRYHSEMGLPVTQEQIRMDEMEDGLEPIEESGLATLALVSTGENLREWTYYAKSEDEFMTHLNEALAGKEPFPIEIHIAPDPEWSMYEKFKAGVKGAAQSVGNSVNG